MNNTKTIKTCDDCGEEVTSWWVEEDQIFCGECNTSCEGANGCECHLCRSYECEKCGDWVDYEDRDDKGGICLDCMRCCDCGCECEHESEDEYEVFPQIFTFKNETYLRDEDWTLYKRLEDGKKGDRVGVYNRVEAKIE